MPRKSIAEMEREVADAHARLADKVRSLEIDLSAAHARAESAERLLETVLRAAFPRGVLGVAPATPPVSTSAPETTTELPAITDAVLRVCREFGPNDRQYALNLQRARDLARKGKTEEQIKRAIYYGEQRTA